MRENEHLVISVSLLVTDLDEHWLLSASSPSSLPSQRLWSTGHVRTSSSLYCACHAGGGLMAPALPTAVAFRWSPCPSLLLSWLPHAWLRAFSRKYPVPPDSWACRWWPLPRTHSTSWFPPLILDELRSVCQELSFHPFSPLILECFKSPSRRNSP